MLKKVKITYRSTLLFLFKYKKCVGAIKLKNIFYFFQPHVPLKSKLIGFLRYWAKISEN